MAHIKLKNEELPGIIGLMHYRPETAEPLNQLAETLLRGPSTLTPGEREIIASSVSWWNDCHFCHTSHGAAAAAHHGGDLNLIDEIKAGLPDRDLSPKLRALLAIAKHVQQGGKKVTGTDIAAAREAGATDLEIHDTVLIAAAFCMYNRYVDGLGTWRPEPKEAYKEVGEMLAFKGYLEAVPA
ncbi:MAG: peroxidase-related enzyme [Bacteroidetes bacterium]|nr:peroxidase-related enzyme [Bacteroidota bacterium]MBX7128056.1 peroxidase-related enzyme [Flavobacteriales bacterium]MCC6655917.1 peroxidase-related enzyme [Flavobacteriales bacterium]HMU14717.1 peroxidase-related enzyme [Flavobacteriales bacterium]HMW97759.1 peroxidase-related enzyme [Flavobacteriales bacterium]